MKVRLIVVAALSLAGCGLSASGKVELQRAALRDVDGHTVLTFDVSNGTTSPIYVYDQVRSVGRDDAPARTSLRLRDVPWTVTGSSADCHLSPPSYQKVEPLLVRSFEARAPAIALERDEELRVELAWSDRPFSTDGSKCSADLAKAMIEIQRDVESATVERQR